jgi:hypothetical protein
MVWVPIRNVLLLPAAVGSILAAAFRIAVLAKGLPANCGNTALSHGRQRKLAGRR